MLIDQRLGEDFTQYQLDPRTPVATHVEASSSGKEVIVCRHDRRVFVLRLEAAAALSVSRGHCDVVEFAVFRSSTGQLYFPPPSLPFLLHCTLNFAFVHDRNDCQHVLWRR
jgi:hypothetical protein